MLKLRITSAGLLTVLALALTCGPIVETSADDQARKGRSIELSARNNGEVVSVRPGDALVIRLPARPSGGWSWRPVQTNVPGLTEFATTRYDSGPKGDGEVRFGRAVEQLTFLKVGPELETPYTLQLSYCFLGRPDPKKQGELIGPEMAAKPNMRFRIVLKRENLP